MTKVKYIEGQVYELKFVKKVFIEEEYMVFEDKHKDRFVIPSMHYRHFKLHPGQLVKCLITRIDCKGKISFEPEHPFYKPGNSYSFDFVRMDVYDDKEYDPLSGKEKKTKQYKIIVTDQQGFEHSVEPKSWQMKKNFTAKSIRCRLVKIVKGHFQLINLENDMPLLKRVLQKFNKENLDED